MTLCFFLKMLSELSLLFIIANSVLSIGLTGVTSVFPVLFYAAVAALAYWMEEKHSKQRLFLLPLLLIPVFLCGNNYGTALTIGLAGLYVGLLIWQQRYYMDHDTQCDRFRTSLAAVCCLTFAFVILLGLDYIVPFVLLFLLSGIYMLRLIRQDAEIFNETKFRVLNLLTIGGIILLTMLVSSDAFLSFCGMILAKIYSILIIPVFYAIYAFGYTLYYIIVKVLFTGDYSNATDQLQSNISNNMQEMMMTGTEEPLVDGTPFLMILKGVILLVGILIVLLWVFNTQKGRSKKEEGSLREAYSAVTVIRPEEKVYADRIPPREPRAAVRYYYRSFLRLCQTLGHEFPRFYTSKTIENTVSHQFDESTLHRLRQTYIRARYSEQEITKEDVSVIKEQVKKLKKASDSNGIRTDSLQDTLRDQRILNTTSETFGKGPDSKMRYNSKL